MSVNIYAEPVIVEWIKQKLLAIFGTGSILDNPLTESNINDRVFLRLRKEMIQRPQYQYDSSTGTSKHPDNISTTPIFSINKVDIDDYQQIKITTNNKNKIEQDTISPKNVAIPLFDKVFRLDLEIYADREDIWIIQNAFISSISTKEMYNGLKFDFGIVKDDDGNIIYDEVMINRINIVGGDSEGMIEELGKNIASCRLYLEFEYTLFYNTSYTLAKIREIEVKIIYDDNIDDNINVIAN